MTYVSDKFMVKVKNDANGREVIDGLKNLGLKLRLRGRHPYRKEVMAAAGLRPNHTNDIPVSLSSEIAIYLR
jgi:hypothetical protein